MQTAPYRSGSSGDSAAGVAAERRTATLVRQRFEEAVLLLAPFFEPGNRWRNMPLHHLAMRVLREHFYSLTNDEIVIMYSAIRRLHEDRRKPVP